MSTTTMNPTNHAARRLRALGRAEWLQFTRNRLLVFAGLVFPLLLPLFLWLVGDQSVGSTAAASEVFVLFALSFGVFYPALSMAVTRRDEGVLKRLRTGESRDWELLTAICLPLAALTLVLAVIVVVAFSSMSMVLPIDPPVPHVWPKNPLIMVIAMLLGVAVSHGLAMLTSRFTQNAEGAQITSMPVLMLVIFSQTGIREYLPESLANVINRTPFVLASDVFRDGWVGEGSFSSLLAGAATPMLLLAVWAAVLISVGYRRMRWETHREV